MILDGLKTRLMEPALFQEFACEFIAVVNKCRSDASSAQAAMQRDLEQVERRIKRLVEVILQGADAQAINAKLKELEAQRAQLLDTLNAAPPEEPLLHPNLAAIYRARVEALETVLRDPSHGREAFELLRGLIEHVKIIPVNQDVTIELHGELAGILALAQGAKGSAKRIPLPRLAWPRMVVSPQELPNGPGTPSRFSFRAIACGDLPAANSRKMRRTILASASLNRSLLARGSPRRRSPVNLPWGTAEEELRHRLTASYRLVRSGLTKKAQAQLDPFE